MNTISYHIKGITTTFSELAKGNFLLYFIPGAVITLAFLVFQYFMSSLQAASELTSDYSWIDWIFGWVNSGVSAVFSILGFITEQIYIFIVLTLLSPFNTMLGEKLDGKLTGHTFKADLMRFINDFIRMVFVVTIALLMEIACLMVWWVISFFLGLGILDPIVYFVISAFFFGFAFYDFAFERYSMKIFSTINFGFTYPLAMILTGSIFLGLYAIPIVGIPISPVISVMVSTIVYLYITKKLPKTSTDLEQQHDE